MYTVLEILPACCASSTSHQVNIFIICVRVPFSGWVLWKTLEEKHILSKFKEGLYNDLYTPRIMLLSSIAVDWQTLARHAQCT